MSFFANKVFEIDNGDPEGVMDLKRSALLFVMALCLLPLCGRAADDTLYPIRENGLWGYMDRAGETVIEPRFAQADPFRGRFARVVLSLDDPDSPGMECIIDRDGNWVFPPDGSEIISRDSSSRYFGGCDDGIYIIYDPGSMMYGFFDIPSGFCSGQRYQWIDSACDPDEDYVCIALNNSKGFASRRTGEIIIPCGYEPDYRYRFRNGYCCVMPVNAEIADGWILIDRQGTEVPMPENCFVCDTVSDGLVPIWNCDTGLCGYMDLTGNIVIEPQYDWAYPFSEGLACVVKNSDEHYSAVITQGNEPIVILQDDQLNRTGSSTTYTHGLLRVAHYDDEYDLIYIFFLDHDGCEVLRLEIEDLLDVSDFDESGIAYYMTGEKTIFGTDENVRYGFFNDRGEILTQSVFDIAASDWDTGFSEGVLPVTFIENGTMGYIDETAAWVIPPQYDSVAGFRDGLALTEKDGKLAYIDHDGAVVWREK